jgi:hypothetical protein
MIIKQHTNLHKNSHDKFDCIMSQSIKTWWISINTKKLSWQIWLYNFTNHQNIKNKQTKTQKLSWHNKKNMCKIFMITWNCDEYKL